VSGFDKISAGVTKLKINDVKFFNARRYIIYRVSHEDLVFLSVVLWYIYILHNSHRFKNYMISKSSWDTLYIMIFNSMKPSYLQSMCHVGMSTEMDLNCIIYYYDVRDNISIKFSIKIYFIYLLSSHKKWSIHVSASPFCLRTF